MLIKRVKKSDETEAAVTDEVTFNNRRNILKGLGFVGATSLLTHAQRASAGWFSSDSATAFQTAPLTYSSPAQFQSNDAQTPEHKATQYNNFYEFGTDKAAPAERAQQLVVKPWQLAITGLVERPITLDYDDLLARFPLQERIYRLRCVEAWSMVIPWIGFQLSDLLAQCQPLSAAKYVAFETLYRPSEMPGQKHPLIGGGIDYPYVEALRLDEAKHPLTLLAVGIYGKTLPPQNGAPIRLVVPWKYGFKSIKTLRRITLTDKRPTTTWNSLAPSEYGFYANVNPSVSHPRWSQAKERRITSGGLLNVRRIATQLFNGYDQVAPMYRKLDMKKFY